MRRNNIKAGILRIAITGMVALFFIILLYSCSSSSRTNAGDTSAPAAPDSASTIPGQDTGTTPVALPDSTR